jgi:hypothetical protein
MAILYVTPSRYMTSSFWNLFNRNDIASKFQLKYQKRFSEEKISRVFVSDTPIECFMTGD